MKGGPPILNVRHCLMFSICRFEGANRGGAWYAGQGGSTLYVEVGTWDDPTVLHVFDFSEMGGGWEGRGGGGEWDNNLLPGFSVYMLHKCLRTLYHWPYMSE